MTLFWAGALALVTLLYVVLDGFDLGVGMILGATHSQDDRRRMLATISPVWDGNETWLVAAVVILFGCFSKVYAALFSAFYLPAALMLSALILRGVAFEFRNKTTRLRWVWDYAFTGGSILATFIQGMMVGQLAEGLPLTDGVYTSGPLLWLNPFSLLCGLGLCFGYMLLGATWLIAKCEGAVRARAYWLAAPLLAAVLGFLAVVFVYALATHLPIMARWVERPWLAVFPLIGLAAVIGLGVHLRDVMSHSPRETPDSQPFLMVSLLFLSAFLTMAASFWPYMVPFSLTIDQAASPHSSQAFMFWGIGIIFLPLTLVYALFSYRVFGGKIVDEAEHAHY